jgi:cystathionine beta-lyase/cystathionine gamma-synthase
VNTSDIEALSHAPLEDTKLVFIETSANPTRKVTDIARAETLAEMAGALLVFDNTLLTPALQKSSLLGADVVLTPLQCLSMDITRPWERPGNRGCTAS